MRLAQQLVLGSSAAVALVMTIYGVATLTQRERIITQTLVRETETLARTMQIVAASGVRTGQVKELNRVLGRVVADPDLVLGAVVDSRGNVMAGGPKASMGCVRPVIARAGRVPEIHTWATCEGGRVRLVVLPLPPPAEALVIARRTTVIDALQAQSRRSIFLTGLALAVLGSLAIVLVLRRWLAAPLASIMAKVAQLGGPEIPRHIDTPRGAARELRDLAGAFNEMVDRLQGKQDTLIRETEERIALERRLRESEVFAAVGRLTGGVAHELGSPLGVISVRADAIQASADATPELRRQAGAIADEVERIARLVRDLLHVARRHGSAPGTVEIARVVSDVVESLRGDAGRAGVAVRVEVPEGGLRVQGDERLLHHALYGVTLNSLQAMEGHAGERAVRISVEPRGGEAVVIVEDTGPGIPPELYPRVFEPFFTTKDVGSGSGLGLAISAGIAEEHGGTLTLVPAAGCGVRAELRLPLANDNREDDDRDRGN
ncbi:MAG TPA: HAMP domain-containing sensor histidine kinase [Longimicrobium sp.]|nr:HAMP domain-containing sensor histidine kinase [Longimicrobium sp.]